MNLWRRIKNLWKISEYRVETPYGYEITKQFLTPDLLEEKVLRKDFPTIQKKSATIIPEKVVDIFAPEQDD